MNLPSLKGATPRGDVGRRCEESLLTRFLEGAGRHHQLNCSGLESVVGLVIASFGEKIGAGFSLSRL